MNRIEALEARFDQLGIAWELDTIAPTDVDLDASAAEQYRLQTIDRPTVDRYALDMRRGDSFPPVIIRRLRNRLIVVGGMHRTHGAIAARTPLSAYLITCTAAQARMLAYEDNRTHGRPLSPGERAELAGRMVRLDKVSTASAAHAVGTGEPQVRMAVDGHRALERSEALGVSGLAAFPYQVRAGVGRIKDDAVFVEACVTVIACNLGGPAVQRLVSQVQAVDTPAALERLEDLRAARAGFGGGRGKKRTDRIRLIDAVLDLLDVDPSAVAFEIDDIDQAAVMSDRLKRAARHLMTIDKAIGARS